MSVQVGPRDREPERRNGCIGTRGAPQRTVRLTGSPPDTRSGRRAPGRHVGGSHRDFVTEYDALRRELAEQLQRLGELLPTLVAGEGPGPLDGASVSVADLVRAGLVEYADPEPVSVSGQLDTDFLRGFLHSAVNSRRSTTTSGTFRFDGKGARVPQMDIAAQRRYGAVFGALREFEERSRRVAELGRQIAALARDGLGNGALEPGD